VFSLRVAEKPRKAHTPVAGDRLRTAFEEHADSLLRLCVLLTRNRAEAEDLVQESFIRIAPKIEALDPAATWPYLRRIALNLWKNRVRRLVLEARHRRIVSEVAAEDLGAERAAVWTAMQRLPARQRACVVLRYYEDLSEAATASVLGCSVGTVKSQTSRALSKLEEALVDGD
jgi:RNA polymerase sigma-70 factor (sigma-E family)